MAAPNRIFLIDASGSMSCKLQDTIGGFNSLVEDQRQMGGQLTLIQFNHTSNVVYANKPIQDVPALTTKNYKPGGWTALWDALGAAISDKSSPASTVVILTDGADTHSTKYTPLHVKDLIAQRTKEGWDFVYAGVDIDAFSIAASMGIPQHSTMTMKRDNMTGGFHGLSQMMTSRTK